MTEQQTPRPELSRRRLLGAAGAGGAAGLALGVGGYALTSGQSSQAATRSAGGQGLGAASVPFHGTHQAGIVEPMQATLHATAFDLAPGAGRPALRTLLRSWSAAAAAMAEGRTPPGLTDNQVALDAGPSSLTVTIGFGASLFARTGLTAQLPEQLAPLPVFPEDRIDRSRSDGDLWVQVCADDPLVAFHAQRTLQRLAAGTAAPRWQMNGFSRAPGATARPMTGRNLMGQVDGTNNPRPTDPDFAKRVFVPASPASPASLSADASPTWMANGSYAVFRRIRMLLDVWDQQSLTLQERVIGRRKSDGAPLSAGAHGSETTPVDLAGQNPDGSLAVPGDAHIRVAAPASNQGAAMLRRGYSYHDGFRPDGAPDAGLLFVCFQADPLAGFVPVQRKLARGDALSRFVVHESTGLYAVPGGAPAGGYVGQTLLEG